MTNQLNAETPISAQSEAPKRQAWIEPEIDVLAVEQTETHFGHGLDGSFGQAADCTAS